MRVAALYDIHGNLTALDAVMRDVREAGVDLVVIGGDVLPGPQPVETLERLLALDIPARFIHGNGDREVLGRMRGISSPTLPEQGRAYVFWTAEQLSARHEEVLASWPPTTRVAVEGLGQVLFCHATPRNDVDIFTSRTTESALRAVFDDTGADVVLCGHTHMQFDRRVGRVRVVNAGSVGMPFMPPGAYWALLGPDVELRRTSYDLELAADQIRGTRFPDATGFAARNILATPSEDQMLETFTRIGLR